MTTSTPYDDHSLQQTNSSLTYSIPWNDFIQSFHEEVPSQNQDEAKKDDSEETLYRIDGYEMM